MTYEPAGAPLDPARGEAIVAAAGGTVFSDAEDPTAVARPVERRVSLSRPVQAAAVGGAGMLAGLLLSRMLPGRGRLISAPPLRRKRRRLKTKQTTSLLVDLHLLDRR